MLKLLDSEIVKTFCLYLACFVVIAQGGIALVNAQFVPAPPAVPVQLSGEDPVSKLDEIVRLQRECKRLLVSIRDKVMIISSQQRDGVIRQISPDDI